MALRDPARDRATLLAAALLGALVLAVAFPGAGGPLASAGLWAACLFLVSRGGSHALLSFDTIYLLWLGLFHLGLVVPIALGAGPDPLPEWIQARDLGLPLGLFNTAVVAFTVGALALAPPRVEDRTPLAAHPPLFAIGAAVALAGAAIFWAGVMQIGLLSGTYNDYYQRSLTEDVRLFGFGFMLLPLGTLIAAVGASPRQIRLVALGYAAVVAPVFLAGFRGPVLVHTAALLTVWIRKDPRVALRAAVVTAVLAIVLAPAIRASRNTGESIVATVQESKPLEFVYESGASLRPLVVTAERVSSRTEPLWMGRSYELAASRVVPNVSSQRRAMVGVVTPNAWASMHETPWTWERGGGIGFSAVAEPYLNFGLAGVVAFFLVLGALLRIGDRALSRSPYAAALAAATFGFLLWAVRNDVMGLVRASSYAAVLVLAAWVIAGVRRRATAAA